MEANGIEANSEREAHATNGEAVKLKQFLIVCLAVHTELKIFFACVGVRKFASGSTIQRKRKPPK